MPLAKTEDTSGGRGRVFDIRRDGGDVLYRSNFDEGFDNWTDHWDAYRPWPIVSLSNHAQHFGRRSLMLSTGEHASPPTGDVSNQTAAFKRMTIADYRYFSYSTYLSLGIGGFNGTWAAFMLYIDTQEVDNSQRSFFKLQCEIKASPDFNRWRIRGDGGDLDWKVVPNTEHVWMGDNDNKQNFGYVRLSIDKHANGGLGGYKECQIGRQTFDLSGLGGGSSLEAPQADSNNITQFNDGFNIGLGLSRNPDIAGGCQLYADDVVLSATNEWSVA